MILTFLELNYGFKDHDLMFMDDFMMFRCTLECWNQLGMKGTSLRNSYKKNAGKMGSQGVPRALRGPGP